MSDAPHLKLLRAGDQVPPSEESPKDSPLQRRGRLYDAVLRGIREYARETDPEVTFDEVGQMLVDFPLFLSGLQLNMRGTGRVRELPNLPGY